MSVAPLRLAEIAGLTLFFFSCSPKEADKVDLQPLSFFTKIGSWKAVSPYQFVTVIITLKNNTSDTIGYASMSCSWQEAYMLNTQELSIPIECDKNFPVSALIPPYGQEQRALTLVTKKKRAELQGREIRVGFNLLIAKDNAEAYEKFKQLHDMKNLMWSAPLQL